MADNHDTTPRTDDGPDGEVRDDDHADGAGWNSPLATWSMFTIGIALVIAIGLLFT